MKFIDHISLSLKALRASKNLTQEQFAEYCNVDYDSYRKWETRKNFPTPDNIDKICEANKISIIDFLLLSEPLKKDKSLIVKNIIEQINRLAKI